MLDAYLYDGLRSPDRPPRRQALARAARTTSPAK